MSFCCDRRDVRNVGAGDDFRDGEADALGAGDHIGHDLPRRPMAPLSARLDGMHQNTRLKHVWLKMACLNGMAYNGKS